MCLCTLRIHRVRLRSLCVCVVDVPAPCVHRMESEATTGACFSQPTNTSVCSSSIVGRTRSSSKRFSRGAPSSGVRPPVGVLLAIFSLSSAHRRCLAMHGVRDPVFVFSSLGVCDVVFLVSVVLSSSPTSSSSLSFSSSSLTFSLSSRSHLHPRSPIVLALLLLLLLKQGV
jgi:hypothetical protein